jgi:hypothetical protein
VNNINLDANDLGVQHLGEVWNAIKSILHGGHYGEGIALVEAGKLRTTYYTNRISKKALEVVNGWMYEGKQVCLTGVNLAARMFGSATYENRRKALDLQRRYFSKFSGVRTLQIDLSRKIERDGALRSAFGFYLQLYGLPFPKLKTGLAVEVVQ